MSLTKMKNAIVLATALSASALTTTNANAGIDPFIGEIMLAGFNFCPRGYAEADGALVAISQNNALFALLGTTFGGDGQTTFGLPDLRGRVPLNFGTGPGLSNVNWGEKGGMEQTTLTINQMPAHSHTVNATDSLADKKGPGLDFLGKVDDVGEAIYHNGPANKQMDPGMIANSGGGQAFSIRNPYLGMKYCIATVGIFPSRQ